MIQVILSHLLTLNCEVFFSFFFLGRLHSQILGALKEFYIIKQSPCNWETTACQNVALTVFHTEKNMSPCVKNSQNHTYMFLCSPIPGTRFEKQGKLICLTVFFLLNLMIFSLRLDTNDAHQCNSDSFPRMVIYFENYISTHSCLPIAWRLFYNVRNFHGPRVWEHSVSNN